MANSLGITSGQAFTSVDFPYAVPTPQDVENILFWGSTYDGVGFAPVGGKVPFLLDLSGQGNDFTQPTVAGQPNVVANALGPVSGLDLHAGGNLANANLQTFNFGAGVPWSVSCVFRYNSNDAGNLFNALFQNATNGHGGQGTGWALATGSNIRYFHGLSQYDAPNQNTAVFGSTPLVNGTVYIAHATNDGTGTAAGVKLYLDNALETPTVYRDTLAGASTADPVAGSASFIGGNGSMNATSSIIFDVVVAGSVYSPTDMALLTSFFMAKHNLS